MAEILIVDDEPHLVKMLGVLLKSHGYDVTEALDGDKAKDLLGSREFDLMLSDIRMSPVNGIELLKFAGEKYPSMVVIMITAFSSLDTAVSSLKLGAFDYIRKPFKMDELLDTIHRGLEYGKTLAQKPDVKGPQKIKYGIDNIVAYSRSMQNVCELIKRVAPTDTPVLIYGESGTGKEAVAGAIHAHSRRKGKKFLAINCATHPEPVLEAEIFGYVRGAFEGASEGKPGIFEAVGGGSAFLNEIESMPPAIQIKLFTALKDRTFRRLGSNKDLSIEARLLTAANSSPGNLIEQGKLREDLHSRLGIIPIEIKPIRERQEDILPTVYHMTGEAAGDVQNPPTVDPEVQAILQSYSWPGNEEELQNVIRSAMQAMKDNMIVKDSLPPKIAATPVSKAVKAADDSRGRALKAFLSSKGKEFSERVLSSKQRS